MAHLANARSIAGLTLKRVVLKRAYPLVAGLAGAGAKGTATRSIAFSAIHL